MTDLREKALRLASILPQGSDARRSLLTVLKREAGREVGQTILEQMGSLRRLNNMLGLTDLAFLPNGVEFGWPNRQRSKGNFVRITLRPDDTYNVEFENISTRGRKLVKKYPMVYVDQLGEVFEKQTGWYLRLGSKKTASLWQEDDEGFRSGVYVGKVKGTAKIDGVPVRLQGTVHFNLGMDGDPEEEEWKVKRLDTRELVPWEIIERHIDNRDMRRLWEDALDEARDKQQRKSGRRS